MSIVIDASVTMAWCFEDEATPAADDVLDRLRNDEATVPPLWQLEVANVLLVAEQRGRISEAQASRFVGLLDQLPIRIDVDVEAFDFARGARRWPSTRLERVRLLISAARRAARSAVGDPRCCVGRCGSRCRRAGAHRRLEPPRSVDDGCAEGGGQQSRTRAVLYSDRRCRMGPQEWEWLSS